MQSITMWTKVGCCLAAFLVIYFTHWIMKWRNPSCNGVLPPGSMGFPLIGETLSLIIPSYSLDLHPFFKNRLERYGPIFRTSLAGRPVVISADPEFNNFLFQQEGKSVELWYLDTFAKILAHGGDAKTNAAGIVHKYVRSIFLNHFGAQRLKGELLPEIQEFVDKTLCSWSSQESVEVKHACSVNQKKVTAMLKNMLKERRDSLEPQHGDFLDQIVSDMDKEKFLSEDFIVHLIFGGFVATFESISAVLALAFSFLAEHPSALQELTAEHEAILKNREDPKSSLTWDEYKSMTFTLQVINETLRLGNGLPGLLRRALEEVPVKGFTIPEGWTIMVLTSVLHLNPNTFKDPIKFDPWRWKDIDSHSVSKNFMPFGGGLRQCAGAEYSRVFLCTFFHVLITKYRWTPIKGARISRNPTLGFGDGIHIKFSENEK